MSMSFLSSNANMLARGQHPLSFQGGSPLPFGESIPHIPHTFLTFISSGISFSSQPILHRAASGERVHFEIHLVTSSAHRYDLKGLR